MILYLCDGKKCKLCGSGVKNCMHTTDINHAVNFKKDDCGDIVEQPAFLEAKDSFTDLVKELNGLIDKYSQLRVIKFPYLSEVFEEQRKRVDDVCKVLELSIASIAKKITEGTRFDLL